jgi:hypothetical protein
LTGDTTRAVYAAAKNCYQKAERAPDGYTDLRSGIPAMLCDLDGANLEIFIAKAKR